MSSRAGARRSIVFAFFFGLGIAELLLADEASPRRLTLADALVFAERPAYEFLLVPGSERV